MTPQISAAYCGDFRHGSISIDGALPQGAPHMWAHSLTDLACALRRDAGAGRFRDHDGAVLAQGQIDSAIAALEAAGFRPGDVGLIEAANTLPVIATMLAVWELGGVVCPIDPDCPDAVRALVAQESGATVLVPANAAPHPLTTERPGRKITLRRPLRVTGVDLAMMIFTSGSSGRPKGVVLTHNNVMSALRAIVGYTGIGPEDRIFAVPPFFFDYGLYQVLIALLTGCELVVANAHRAVNKLAPILAQTQPTILPVVPALASGLGRMLEMTARSVPSVRLVTNTGGHLSEATIALLSKVLPNAAMMPMYGLTECKRATYCDRRLYPDATDSIGVAMPGLEAAVVVDTPEGLREAQPGKPANSGCGALR